MAITFAPKRGAILMCDFDMACVPPEMRKVRQVVVVSPDGMNHRHGRVAGTCTVVPFTTVRPGTIGPDDVFIPSRSYWSLPKDSWARAKMVATVSHDRLDLVLRNGRRHPTEFISQLHLGAIEVALKHALGIPLK